MAATPSGEQFELRFGEQHAAVTAACRAPAPWRIEREILWIKFREGLSGFDIGSRRGKPRQHVALRSEQKTRAFAEAERLQMDYLNGVTLEDLLPTPLDLAVFKL